jgi:hypothetical protein
MHQWINQREIYFSSQISTERRIKERKKGFVRTSILLWLTHFFRKNFGIKFEAIIYISLKK